MDDNRKTSNQGGLEELRRRQAARQAGAPATDAPVRRSPARGPGLQWLCIPVVAVLAVAAIGFGVYRSGAGGEPVSSPPDAPAEPAVQEPVVPVDVPDQTPDPALGDQTPQSVPEDPQDPALEGQTPQTVPEDQQEPVQAPPAPVEPDEPEVDHTGQKWAMLCDGTVVYKNDARSLGDLVAESVEDPSRSDVSAWLCPGGEGNIVSDITLGYAEHYGHEVPGGSAARSVRWGSDVTVSEFLSGTGFSSFDELVAANKSDDVLFGSDADGLPPVDYHGTLPVVDRRSGAPDTIDPSKPVVAYKKNLGFSSTCTDCTGPWDFTINGAPLYDLDAVIGVLGMPTCAVGGQFVDPEYFEASEGDFDTYVWNMGKAGLLCICFKEDVHMFRITSEIDTILRSFGRWLTW